MITVSIVTYKTDLVELAKCLQSLFSPLVSKVYVIDNSNHSSIYNRLLLNILYVINQKYGLNL